MIGGAIFLVGFFFFEVILGIGGMGLARVGMSRLSWPVLLIGIGVIVIIYTLMSPRDDTPTRPGDAG
jgi:hydrogenase/urease accessory protein HupE